MLRNVKLADQNSRVFLLALAAIAICSLCPQLAFAYNVGAFYDETLTLNTADHGDSIEEVAAAIRSLDYEVLAYFDQYGHKLFEISDMDAGSVMTCSDIVGYLSQFEDITCIHNHPIDATFSRGDFCHAALLNVKCSVVVSEERTYFMLRGKDGWPAVNTLYAHIDSLVNIESAREIISASYDESGQMTTFSWALTESGIRTITNTYGLDYHWVWHADDGNEISHYLYWMANN